MPTNTYELIESHLVTSSVTSIAFTSLTQSYRDLVIVAEGISAGTDDVFISANNDLGSNYPTVFLYGDTNDISGKVTTTGFYSGRFSSGTRSSLISTILDYPASDKYKVALSRYGYGDDVVGATVSTWTNADPISSLTVRQPSGFAAGTIISIYGIVS